MSKVLNFQQRFRAQLPNEPRILNAATQVNLTEKFLLPARAELEIFFLAVRTLVDQTQQNLMPVKLGKPYPVGQCLEITQAVQKILPQLDPARLEPAAARGHAAFSAFQTAGGAFRQVWGDLRGEFFQNAFQLGTLYVDVANDTVTITKPKVEILPFIEAKLTAITDFRHFARLAARYWKERVFPNHVLPELAPYFPLLHVNSDGKVLLREYSDYMVALTLARQFLPSEEVLRAPVMPLEVFDHVASIMAMTRLKFAASPSAGRAQALRLCREYRDKRWYALPTQTKNFKRIVEQANNCLLAQPGNAELYTSTAAASEGSY